MKNTMKGIGPYSARIDRPPRRGVPHAFPPAENPEPGHGRKAVVPRPSRPDGRSAFHSACLPAGVLATVLVVSALMLLSVLGVLALWESDFLFFSRAGYLSRQRANVESAFVLYAADSTLTARLDEQGGLRLYDGLPDSRVRIAVRPWGLYEAVRIEAADSRIAPTRLFGSAAPFAWFAGRRKRSLVCDRCRFVVACGTHLAARMLEASPPRRAVRTNPFDLFLRRTDRRSPYRLCR